MKQLKIQIEQEYDEETEQGGWVYQEFTEA